MLSIEINYNIHIEVYILLVAFFQAILRFNSLMMYVIVHDISQNCNVYQQYWDKVLQLQVDIRLLIIIRFTWNYFQVIWIMILCMH